MSSDQYSPTAITDNQYTAGSQYNTATTQPYNASTGQYGQGSVSGQYSTSYSAYPVDGQLVLIETVTFAATTAVKLAATKTNNASGSKEEEKADKKQDVKSSTEAKSGGANSSQDKTSPTSKASAANKSSKDSSKDSGTGSKPGSGVDVEEEVVAKPGMTKEEIEREKEIQKKNPRVCGNSGGEKSAGGGGAAKSAGEAAPKPSPDAAADAGKAGEEAPEPNKYEYCTLCGVSFTSLKQAEQHYNGKNHAKKMRLDAASKVLEEAASKQIVKK
nr:hypothetical protein BaRGS_005287 [Batillaria attramentaria]